MNYTLSETSAQEAIVRGGIKEPFQHPLWFFLR